jgi:hypothetical protein
MLAIEIESVADEGCLTPNLGECGVRYRPESRPALLVFG